MDIGTPQRVITVEPVENPVPLPEREPREPTPEREPARPVREPEKVPA